MTARAGRSAAMYRELALSPKTVSCYASDVRRFKAVGGRIPTTPQALAGYLAREASRLQPATLMRRIAAIAHEHTRRGLRSPTRALIVQQTMRGIRRAYGGGSRQAKPISIDLLRKLVRRVPDHSKSRNLRDRALLLLGFAGGFRRSELASLQLGDLQFTRRGLVIRLRKSKTDPYSVGRNVAVVYAKTPQLCPVRALRSWLEHSNNSSTPVGERRCGAPHWRYSQGLTVMDTCIPD